MTPQFDVRSLFPVNLDNSEVVERLADHFKALVASSRASILE